MSSGGREFLREKIDEDEGESAIAAAAMAVCWMKGFAAERRRRMFEFWRSVGEDVEGLRESERAKE